MQHQRSQVAGEREDHMQVARGEQFSLTGGDPPFPSRDLTLWTVTITAANGDLSVSCIMGSIFNRGVGSEWCVVLAG